jgi:hypothetical protein
MISAVDTPTGTAAAPQLEPTYSPAEVAKAWGVCLHTVLRLVDTGRRARGLDPRRGGLWPVIRPTARIIRIPAGAIRRHLDHMERVSALGPLPCPTRSRNVG